MLEQAKRRALKAELDFDLTVEWILERIDVGRCEATGIRFELEPRHPGQGPRSQASPSIDRVNPKAGYTKDNCRVVVWVYNRAKNDLTDAQFLSLCKLVIGQGR